ncbi:hypothetical protein AA313_de0204922 [Arthrobotrys entomopaga]|nr:hypothetical protein AA313_de0204922 [Arthrobotrys entomopaga]
MEPQNTAGHMSRRRQENTKAHPAPYTLVAPIETTTIATDISLQEDAFDPFNDYSGFFAATQFQGEPARPPSTGDLAFPDNGNQNTLPSTAITPDLKPGAGAPAGFSEFDNLKRKASRSPEPYSYSNLPPDHPFYHNFNYEPYSPLKTNRGKDVGTRSMDHCPDTELPKRYATYAFQHDPIKHWPLRDVAEKYPTKIREKEKKYEAQLELTDEKEDLLPRYFDAAGDVMMPPPPPDSKGSKRRRLDKRNSKSDEELELTHHEHEQNTGKTKGVNNWQKNFMKKYPGAPVPCQIPNYRPVIHALLYAGRSGHGPQDFYTLIRRTIERCAEEEFRRFLLEKLDSLTIHPPTHSLTTNRLEHADYHASTSTITAPGQRFDSSHQMNDSKQSVQTQVSPDHQGPGGSAYPHSSQGDSIYPAISPSNFSRDICSGSGLRSNIDNESQATLAFSDINHEAMMLGFPGYPALVEIDPDEGDNNA